MTFSGQRACWDTESAGLTLLSNCGFTCADVVFSLC